MNGHDWTSKFVSKMLQITNSQWICRNTSLHDEEIGYLRRKEMKAMKFEAEEMACTNPADLPRGSRFLLEMDGVKNLNKCLAYHDMNYWLGAMRAAIKAGKRMYSTGRRARKAVKKMKKSAK